MPGWRPGNGAKKAGRDARNGDQAPRGSAPPPTRSGGNGVLAPAGLGAGETRRLAVFYKFAILPALARIAGAAAVLHYLFPMAHTIFIQALDNKPAEARFGSFLADGKVVIVFVGLQVGHSDAGRDIAINEIVRQVCPGCRLEDIRLLCGTAATSPAYLVEYCLQPDMADVSARGGFSVVDDLAGSVKVVTKHTGENITGAAADDARARAGLPSSKS